MYSKTIAFLILSLAGWLGVSHLFTENEVAVVIDNIIQLVGIFGAWWGRYKAVSPVTVLGFRR